MARQPTESLHRILGDLLGRARWRFLRALYGCIHIFSCRRCSALHQKPHQSPSRAIKMKNGDIFFSLAVMYVFDSSTSCQTDKCNWMTAQRIAGLRSRDSQRLRINNNLKRPAYVRMCNVTAEHIRGGVEKRRSRTRVPNAFARPLIVC